MDYQQENTDPGTSDFNNNLLTLCVEDKMDIPPHDESTRGKYDE